MASYKINHILRPGVLERAEPSLLLIFLGRHEEALASVGITLPTEATQESIPYRELLDFFSNLKLDSHPELAEALFYVNEISTGDSFDSLLDYCNDHDVAVGDGDTKEDLAIRLWLKAPELLERLHAEALVYNCQRFDYFRPPVPPQHEFRMPSEAILKQISSDLDDWFDRKKRGRNCRVFCYENDGLFRFLVLHGEPYTRVTAFKDGESEPIHYRPAKHDVLIYNPAKGEIGINTRSKGLRQEYLRVFGDRIFGSEDHFPATLKYTCKPLSKLGQDSLSLGQFSEFFEWIKLREVHVDIGGIHNAEDIHRADDLLADFEARNKRLPEEGISSFKLAVKFIGERQPRLLTIQPPFTSRMTRESDGLVMEAWLTQQGYIVDMQQQLTSPQNV